MSYTWTRSLVCESVENAFRGRGGAFGRTRGEVERLLNYPIRVPGLDTDEWRMLLARSECRAAGESCDERRRGLGVSSGHFERGWRRCADMISAGLNVERLNRAAFLANQEAEERGLQSGKLVESELPKVIIASAPARSQKAP